MKTIQKGNLVSKGIGIGRAYIYKQYIPQINEEIIDISLVGQELEKFISTKQQAFLEIEKIQKLLEDKNDDKAEIFDAHLEILSDAAVIKEINTLIKDKHYSFRYAIKTVYDKYIHMLLQVDDLLMGERVADLKDVRNRLFRISDGVEESNLSLLNQFSIVIAQDLYPSQTATLDRENVQAIITEVGGMTSHTAIIAKSYEIPAILGVDHVFDDIKQNDWMIVDAINGKIMINPNNETIEKYKNMQKDYLFKQEIVKRFVGIKPVTRDGIKIDVDLNIGSASQEELENEPFVDGIGLFRSEFLYMESTQMPTEDAQFEVYKKTLEKFKMKPVVLRTFDIGGDKDLDYLKLPKEDNPFLGNRAIRLSFNYIEMFKTQLRAALRASVFGNLWLMFPMVGSLDDIYKIQAILEDVKKELNDQKIKYNPSFKFGIMIEIPSIIMVADHVAEIVDFASIGTNDLCQYLLAVDRMNPMVSNYFQSYAPSMFRVMKMAIDAFNKAGKPLSVCGESGGDLIAAPVLLGMGMRKLSMNNSSVAGIKKMITSHQMSELEDIANHVLSLKTEDEVVKYVQSKLSSEE